MDSSGSVKGEVAGSCKCGDKTLGFIRDRELSDCKNVQVSAAWSSKVRIPVNAFKLKIQDNLFTIRRIV